LGQRRRRQADLGGLEAGNRGILKRFQAKWEPVRVKKTRQTKRLGPGSM
jgi:hypothetical protein